jgi:hypothetical protein
MTPRSCFLQVAEPKQSGGLDSLPAHRRPKGPAADYRAGGIASSTRSEFDIG